MPLTEAYFALQVAIVVSLLVGAAGYLVQVRALALCVGIAAHCLGCLARIYD